MLSISQLFVHLHAHKIGKHWVDWYSGDGRRLMVQELVSSNPIARYWIDIFHKILLQQ